MNGVFIISPDTDNGKTFVSTLLLTALQDKKKLKYLKLVQAGRDKYGNSDSDAIANNVSPEYILPPVYDLKLAASPHFSAQQEGVIIEKDILLNSINSYKDCFLIIESAGGVYSPFNKDYFVIDLAYDLRQLAIMPIMVFYAKLGMISQALMAHQAMINKNTSKYDYIFTGLSNDENIISSCELINSKINNKNIGNIPFINNINKENINAVSKKLMVDHL